MTVQTVPYALQNASHSAALFRQSASAPFSAAGILGTGELAVTQQSTPNMSVQLGAGRAKVAGTSVSPPSGFAWTTQAMYDVLNDAAISLTVTTSNPTNPRIDAVYIQVQDSFYSGATNQAVAAIQAGTPAASPVPPSIPTNATLLAYIAVAANATSIVAANITTQVSTAKLLAGGQGLAPIIPTSVAGTGVTLGSGGTVSFSSSAAISINGCFSATFDNYLIVVEVTGASTSSQPQIRLRASGTDDSGSNYDSETIFSSSSTPSAVPNAAQAQWGSFAAVNTPNFHRLKLDLFDPFLARNTMGIGLMTSFQAAAVPGLATAAVTHRNATSFDGFSIVTGGPTISGIVRIYGYNNE